MKFDSPRADELAFVYDSWSRSFRRSPWAGCVPNHLWDQVSRADISGILNRGARIMLAVTPIEGSDERRITGYSVSEPSRCLLHWLYIKDDFRGFGFGQELLIETVRAWPVDRPWHYSHRTNASERFLGRHFRHNPIPARTK